MNTDLNYYMDYKSTLYYIKVLHLYISIDRYQTYIKLRVYKKKK